MGEESVGALARFEGFEAGLGIGAQVLEHGGAGELAAEGAVVDDTHDGTGSLELGVQVALAGFRPGLSGDGLPVSEWTDADRACGGPHESGHESASCSWRPKERR